jgi:hypothetical protein
MVILQCILKLFVLNSINYSLTCTVWSKLLMILITLLVDDLVILRPEVAEVKSLASAIDCFLLIDDCLDQPEPVAGVVVEFHPPDFLP